jgi:hypothetical protein
LASTPASGQFPIGTGTAYALGTITNGGGIGISVVSGNIQLTNSGVISLTSSLSGISVGTGTGNVTLSGTLGVANGGTGATTSTGTGSVVLSNSPSLVTPALGTPSSGTLTNCTGYPSSALSGAVPVSAGGTGTTTAFTLGSVVFAGASGAYSQNNANFFWDNTNARLGIGTTTPTQKLSVTGNSIVSGNSYFSDTSYYAYVSGSSVWLNFDANDSIEYQRTTNQLVGYIGGAATFAVDSTGNFRINSGYGSVATAYGCRAWVNFNGTGTVAIRASGNVSSITDNGTGDYTVNFTNAMPDANYAMVAGATWNNDAVPLVQRGDVAPTSSSIRIWLKMVGYSAGSNDAEWANVAIFR